MSIIVNDTAAITAIIKDVAYDTEHSGVNCDAIKTESAIIKYLKIFLTCFLETKPWYIYIII